MADTIFALASGPPPAGIAVIRLSGPGSFDFVRRLTGTRVLPPPRRAMLRSIRHPETQQEIDRALILIFPGPHSFTGEDVAEFHCHGSPAAVSALCRALAALGARPAEAGEFTRRAFLSGRIDLTQAEALADLIAAETDAQRDQALAQAGGRLRERAEGWRDALLALMAEVEADLDFADEGDVTATRESITPALAALTADIESALASAPLAERIRQGLTIAVIGPPNVGKSSLVNALSRRDVAIVTPHAGTTRDVIEVHLDLAGRPATLLDTAGLRDTDDPVEAEGIARARARTAAADLILDLGPGGNVVNRIDESGLAPGFRDGRLHVSAKTGAGLAELEAWLADWATRAIPAGEPPSVTSARQAALLSETLAALRSAGRETDPVLIAEALRAAAHALGRLTGRIDPEAVLGAIFSRFCIGK